MLTAEASGPLPVPVAPLRIAWRGGVDLNPLDVSDPDAMAWLENLVWPEQDARRRRLRTAVGIARVDPPALRTGDLVDHLLALLDDAAPHGTPVVFHFAVIAYLEDATRRRFHDLMTGLVAAGRCRWISNEAPRVLPGVTALDGAPVALSHGHGHTLGWLT